MDDILKEQIIETMQILHSQIGETVKIDDWISTNGRNYDRHQTTYSKMVLKMDNFSIRMSGSIATLGNETQQIEFRTDSIKFISKREDVFFMEINMSENIWRKIEICKLNPVDNNGYDDRFAIASSIT